MATASSTLAGGTVNNSGLISSDGLVTASLNNQADGEVRVAIGEQLRLTAADNTNAGQVNLFGGTIELTQDLSNQIGGFISGNGTLIIAGVLTNDGTMNLSATANVAGDVTNNASGLIISAGGTTTFFDDVVNNGEIRTSENSFSVYFGSYSGNGDTFEIITAASVLGVFDTVNLPALPGDLLWFVNYGATSVELISTFGADFDEDGNVDGTDLAAWKAGFGNAPAVHRTGDANADTVANGFDFLLWQRQFGSGGVTVAATATIPEPATWCMLLMGLVTVSMKKHSGKHG